MAQRDRIGPLHSQVMITGPLTLRIIGPFHSPFEDQLDAGPVLSSILLTSQKAEPVKEGTKHQ